MSPLTCSYRPAYAGPSIENTCSGPLPLTIWASWPTVMTLPSGSVTVAPRCIIWSITACGLPPASCLMVETAAARSPIACWGACGLGLL